MLITKLLACRKSLGAVLWSKVLIGTINKPRLISGSCENVYRRWEIMSWWGENVSYGKISQSGRWSTGISSAKKAISSSRRCAVSVSLVMTSVKPGCFCAALAMASAWLLLFNAPQKRRSPDLMGREGERGLETDCLGIEWLFLKWQI